MQEFNLAQWIPQARQLSQQFQDSDIDAFLVAKQLRKLLERRRDGFLLCMRRKDERLFLWKGSLESLETQVRERMLLGWQLDPQVFVEAKASGKRKRDESESPKKKESSLEKWADG